MRYLIHRNIYDNNVLMDKADQEVWLKMEYMNESRKIPLEDILGLIDKKYFVAVAKIEDDSLSLDDIFSSTQNGVNPNSWSIDGPDEISPILDSINMDGNKYGLKSTSSGDMILDGDQLHVVTTSDFVSYDLGGLMLEVVGVDGEIVTNEPVHSMKFG